jgi:hypothetical protein
MHTRLHLKDIYVLVFRAYAIVLSKQLADKIRFSLQNRDNGTGQYIKKIFVRRNEEDGIQDKAMARKMFLLLCMQSTHWYSEFHSP